MSQTSSEIFLECAEINLPNANCSFTENLANLKNEERKNPKKKHDLNPNRSRTKMHSIRKDRAHKSLRLPSVLLNEIAALSFLQRTNVSMVSDLYATACTTWGTIIKPENVLYR